LAAAAGTGCGADKSEEVTSGEPEPAVSWNRHIAPIVARSCTGCHRTGGIAPMSLETYGSAKHYAGEMLAQVQSGAMPPWGARTTDECTPTYGFKNDPRLSPDELQLLQAWVEDGAPEGGSYKAPLPKPAITELTDADLHLTIPSAVEVTGTDDRFVCFTLDPKLDHARWINGVQVTPGNAEIVHHVLLFSDPDAKSATLANENGYYDCFGGPNLGDSVVAGDSVAAPSYALLGAWAPGAVPAITPEGVALELAAGSRLVMQVHYHPHADIQSGVDASTSVDLRFTTKAPDYIGRLQLAGNFDKPDMPIAGGKDFGLMPGDDDPTSGPAFVIPANATAHVETERALVQSPTVMNTSLVKQYRVWGVGTHMHYVGRDMKIELDHADGTSECLLQTPAWDFDWQRLYYYDAPLLSTPVAAPGDVVTMRCTYDNSMNNESVRTALAQQGLGAPRDVRLGETTLDEMCLGVFGVALETNSLF